MFFVYFYMLFTFPSIFQLFNLTNFSTFIILVYITIQTERLELHMRLRNIPGAKDAISESSYVIHNPVDQKGHWKELFENTNPIHIEVGMGKGRFLMDLAKQNPQINYIGFEMYDSVLLRALQKMEERENKGTRLPNVFFVRMDARELPLIFTTQEIEKIYLNFSDPWPKERHAKRRLTSRQFLKRYDEILSRQGTIEFKTDNKDLFDFSLEEIKEAGWKLLAWTYDLHHNEQMNNGNIMTEYEEKFSLAGNPICKLIASR